MNNTKKIKAIITEKETELKKISTALCNLKINNINQEEIDNLFEILNNIYEEKKFQNVIKIIKSYSDAKAIKDERKQYECCANGLLREKIIYKKTGIFSTFSRIKHTSIIDALDSAAKQFGSKTIWRIFNTRGKLDSVIKEFGYDTKKFGKDGSRSGLKKYENRIESLKRILIIDLIKRHDHILKEINELELESNLIANKEEKHLKLPSKKLEKENKTGNNILTDYQDLGKTKPSTPATKSIDSSNKEVIKNSSTISNKSIILNTYINQSHNNDCDTNCNIDELDNESCNDSEGMDEKICINKNDTLAQRLEYYNNLSVIISEHSIRTKNNLNLDSKSQHINSLN